MSHKKIRAFKSKGIITTIFVFKKILMEIEDQSINKGKWKLQD